MLRPGFVSRYGGPPPPFSPSDLSGLQVWLKEDGLSGTDGTAVSSWSDSSGNSNHAAQGTGANQPVKKTNIVNGRAVCRFDGTNDILTLTTELTVTDFTLFVVYQTSGDNCLLGSATQNNQLVRVGEFGLNKWSFYNGSGAVPSDTFGTARTSWNHGCFRRASDVVEWYEDGTARGTTTQGLSVKMGSVGALGNPLALYTNGDIAEVVAYDVALSSTDRQSVEAYIGSRFGL